MKFKNPDLLMTVEAIDLTETEMESIVGGLFTSSNYYGFLTQYSNDTTANKTASIASITQAIQAEVNNNPTNICTDITNLTTWFKGLDSNTQSLIKNDNNIRQAINTFGQNNPQIQQKINKLFANLGAN